MQYGGETGEKRVMQAGQRKGAMTREKICAMGSWTIF